MCRRVGGDVPLGASVIGVGHVELNTIHMKYTGLVFATILVRIARARSIGARNTQSRRGNMKDVEAADTELSSMCRNHTASCFRCRVASSHCPRACSCFLFLFYAFCLSIRQWPQSWRRIHN